MDSSNGGFLRSIANFAGSSETNPDLSPRDKRVLVSVEKALASFDTLEEWADYIAFLARLHKSLALPEDKPHSVTWIPLAEEVSAKLALCLSPVLPNGVHTKTLELYEVIFRALDVKTLNVQISIWLPGILPVVSFGSMQVKPQVLSLYKNWILKYLTPLTLKELTKPLLLSLLCGLDDENSEVYADVMALLDEFKTKAGDNAHFWSTFFVCVITSPEKRLGALNWCTARLPTFATIGQGTTSTFSAEAQACLATEPGLLVRAIAAALNTRSSFNQANDIIVMRGFFDLLLSHLPMDSSVISDVVVPADKTLLIMACCRVTLRKDMSLNRRLWKWLLGPDSGEDTSRSEDRIAYFETHALAVIREGLISLISAESVDERLDGFRISLALIMDRWEISQLITPVVFVPVIKSCFASFQKKEARSGELLMAGKRFFDEVGAAHIWRYLTHEMIVKDESGEFLVQIDFLLKNFEFPDDEHSVHVPFAIVAFLAIHRPSSATLVTVGTLLELLSSKSHSTDIQFEVPAGIDNTSLLNSVKEYYSGSDLENPPLSSNVISSLIVKKLEQWYIESMGEGSISDKLASILCEVSSRFGSAFDAFGDDVLKRTFLKLSPPSEAFDEPESSVQTMFGVFRIFRLLHPKFSNSEKSRLLKTILTSLWTCLVSSYPANNQVEAVRCIFEMRHYFDIHEIEAGMSHLLLNTPQSRRVHAFYKLWSLSQDMSDSENSLSNPLFIILEFFRDSKQQGYKDVSRLIHNFCSDGTANRFLKIVTNPLLAFSVMKKDRTTINSHDDFALLAYHIETILFLIESNEKSVKEILAHEFVTSESAERFELFSSNAWDVSNYKSLLLYVCQKCLNLRFPETAVSKETLEKYTNCISTVLDLHSKLVSGTDPDFSIHFNLLISACQYYVSKSSTKRADIGHLESLFITSIRDFLAKGKSVNFDLAKLHQTEETDSSFTTFINHGLANCTSAMIFDQWLFLMKSSLHSLGKSVYSGMLTFNHTIIQRAEECFASIKTYERFEGCVDPESFLTICLSGIEDLLAIGHSYLLTPSSGASAKTPQGENGFFGNVISGVFQIESPLVKSEEEQRAYAVIVAFQDAIKFAFGVWSWADGKPQATLGGSGLSSEKSVASMATKLRFRAKRLLESMGELERQETIESLLETDHAIETKIKILHVLDSGHSQLSLPHILNSILTRCSPQLLTDKQKATMYSAVTEKQLTEFLVPYYASIDADTLDEIWDMSLAFFKEVSLHPSHFKTSLFTILHVMKTVLLKAHARKSADNKRNIRDLTGYFLAVLNAAVSKMAHLAPDKSDPQIESLTLLVESLSDFILDQDKITTAVTTIISTIVLSEAKPKASRVHPSVLRLILLIGKKYPIRAWKQVVLDTFMESAFIDHGKFHNSDWQAIVGVWIEKDKDRMGELIGKITPPVQPSAANIFMWNERSEVETRVMVLRRISYLLLVQPKDSFVKNLDDIIGRLATALNSSCPALYRSEALAVFRAISLKFSEGHLLPYWSLVVQTLVDVFSEALAKPTKTFSSIEADELALILSACKLLDQLLLIQFDEVNLTSWLFVSRGSVGDENATSLIDRLARKSEALLTKEDPINVRGPVKGKKAGSLLAGTPEIKNIANLKKFFGSLGYINFERAYGLFEADLTGCEADLLEDMRR